jgi:hypothetical protein
VARRENCSTDDLRRNGDDICHRKRRASKIMKVIAKMPLHSSKDRMAFILLTLKPLENLKTDDAVAKYEVGLGGEPCVNFLKDKKQAGSRRPALAKGQFHEALELFEIMKVESVFGGLYSSRGPRAAKRARR